MCVCVGGVPHGGISFGGGGGEGLKKIVDGGCVETLGGRNFQKLSYLVGGGRVVPKILPERGDNPEKGDRGGLM